MEMLISVNCGFQALKLLNTHYEPVLHELVEDRISHMDRQGISFQLGEVRWVLGYTPERWVFGKVSSTLSLCTS